MVESLLLTATPHRGKENFFRSLSNLLDPVTYPWDPDNYQYKDRLRPSRLSFFYEGSKKKCVPWMARGSF
jgi:hypothetical protein